MPGTQAEEWGEKVERNHGENGKRFRGRLLLEIKRLRKREKKTKEITPMLERKSNESHFLREFPVIIEEAGAQYKTIDIPKKL